MRELEIGKVYKHFKGKHSYVMDVGKHSESKEDMVIYMREDSCVCVRPTSMFLEEVEPNNPGNTTNQTYRFEVDPDFDKRVFDMKPKDLSENIKAGQRYLHFKGEQYDIVAVALDSETKQHMVAYRNINTGKICIRPEEMFLDDFDHTRSDNITGQKVRFQLVKEKNLER